MGSRGHSASQVLAKRSCIQENKKEDIAIDAYTSWLTEHPSALINFEGLMDKAEGKKVFVFLDYDGTLSPIVDDPDKAFMTDAMRSALNEVAHCFPTAIISGRCLDKVNDFVKLNNIYYAGSHGMDISAPEGSPKYKDSLRQTRIIDEKGNGVVPFQPAKDYLHHIQEIKELLKEKLKGIEGAMVEDNRFCISVHFRRVKEKDFQILKDLVYSAMHAYPDFRIMGGRKVMEIRPPIDWDKGCALEYLLEALGFNSCSGDIPIYIGDDKTDEDAFKVLKDLGCGYPIVVSSIPKATSASCSLKNTDEVMTFLTRLANWKSNSSSH